jgi:hypothetical protein
MKSSQRPEQSPMEVQDHCHLVRGIVKLWSMSPTFTDTIKLAYLEPKKWQYKTHFFIKLIS